jgi:1-deoxy-D-xylulose-5-phosphate synthase
MLAYRIKSPQDLKGLSMEELKVLADEMRGLIIEAVSKNGGHLSSNLGVVELTIALHYVLNSPEDKIVWDVGHQSYTHKLLTGRHGLMGTLRKFGGLSGFPNMKESPHDAFGAGHSSTSVSAALGIIEARDKAGDKYNVVAVIGDGALTAGLAFEGLNQAGHLKKNLIVILNDNEMSISPNVGAMSEYLHRVLTGSFYKKMKEETKIRLKGSKLGESVVKIAEKAEGSVKGFLLPGGIFEELGFNYLGPIDGHDIPLLINTLKSILNSDEPVLLHIVTKKGKGYKFSEDDPCVFHGIGPFEIETGEVNGVVNKHETLGACVSYSEGFGNALMEAAAEDNRIIAITAAMKEGTGLAAFAERFPDRFYDVGIAEQHATTFAGGLASRGFRPVVTVYSTFIQRAYDQIIHDVCLQNLPVIFAIDRAGIVGEDGATHQGLFDISFLRNVPNMVFMAPADMPELRKMLRFAIGLNCPVAIRYPRAKAFELQRIGKDSDLSSGVAEVVREGTDVAIFGIGNTVLPAIKAADLLKHDGITATVVNARFIKPLDERLIVDIAQKVKKIITVEENVLAGGFGSAVLECLNDAGIPGVAVRRIGIDDEFVEHGAQRILREKYGLDEQGIYKTALDFLRGKASRQPGRTGE